MAFGSEFSSSAAVAAAATAAGAFLWLGAAGFGGVEEGVVVFREAYAAVFQIGICRGGVGHVAHHAFKAALDQDGGQDTQGNGYDQGQGQRDGHVGIVAEEFFQ